MTAASPGQPRLLQRIRHEIRDRGPLTFARFMELALHDAEFGYYSAGPERLGERGDFITASDLGPAFGACLARQTVEFDQLCGQPPGFDLIEYGAGRGWLARDLQAALARTRPNVAERMRYTAVDASAGMRRAIAENAPRATPMAPREVPGASCGCLLAIELFDALPVHRVRRREGRVEEIGVGLRGEQLCEVVLDPDRELLAAVERYDAVAVEGPEAEVCLVLGSVFADFDRALERGFTLVVDYGATADELYGAARGRGTLLAYSGHETNEAYLDRVGAQDLTAHVNFSALCDAAESHGWRLVGKTTQDRFLIANGILDVFERLDDASYRDPAAIRERLQIKELIQPGGMGRVFQVWVFCKGFDELPTLAGLADPFEHRAQGTRG